MSEAESTLYSIYGAMTRKKGMADAEKYLEEYANAEVLAVLERLEKKKVGVMNDFGTHWGIPLAAIEQEKQNYAKQ